MLRPNSPDLKAYLHRAPIDMRAGRNRLATLVREVIRQDPFQPAFFIFHTRWPVRVSLGSFTRAAARGISGSHTCQPESGVEIGNTDIGTADRI
jgi:hypothetical protein